MSYVVLIPDEFGDLAVVDLDMLNEAVKDGDFAWAMGEASFDTINPRDLHAFHEHLTRIRALNAGGEPADYWRT